jgi:hypothetical protein
MNRDLMPKSGQFDFFTKKKLRKPVHVRSRISPTHWSNREPSLNTNEIEGEISAVRGGRA